MVVAAAEELRGRDRYEKLNVLGTGTFGDVYRVLDKRSGRHLAVKKIRMGKDTDGLDMTALREIKLLRELSAAAAAAASDNAKVNVGGGGSGSSGGGGGGGGKDASPDSGHQCVVLLTDVYQRKHNVHLVFELMAYDLEDVIRDRGTILSPGDVKSFCQMMLEGVAFCHRNYVVHRDLKPNNLLIDGSTGRLKLADFGLARIFGSPDPKFTTQVCQLWYRPPELIFGMSAYDSCVDIWGAGCIFAELLLRRVLFEGASDVDQLGRIFDVLGAPDNSTWPGVESLPDFLQFKKEPRQPLKAILRGISDDAVSLLSQMLTLDPSRRISAADALRHSYFRNEPAPTPCAQLPKPQLKNHTVRGPEDLPAELQAILGPVQHTPEPKTKPSRDGPGDGDSTAADSAATPSAEEEDAEADGGGSRPRRRRLDAAGTAVDVDDSSHRTPLPSQQQQQQRRQQQQQGEQHPRAPIEPAATTIGPQKRNREPLGDSPVPMMMPMSTGLGKHLIRDSAPITAPASADDSVTPASDLSRGPPALNTVDRQFLRMRSMKLEDRMNEDDDGDQDPDPDPDPDPDRNRDRDDGDDDDDDDNDDDDDRGGRRRRRRRLGGAMPLPDL